MSYFGIRNCNGEGTPVCLVLVDSIILRHASSTKIILIASISLVRLGCLGGTRTSGGTNGITPDAESCLWFPHPRMNPTQGPLAPSHVGMAALLPMAQIPSLPGSPHRFQQWVTGQHTSPFFKHRQACSIAN